MMNKIFFMKIKLCCFVLGILINSVSFGVSIVAENDKKIELKISKTGLNRISNSPYKIMQVTGDDSTFKIKHDEDGQNLYLMPLAEVGSKIEISIRNNASQVQDLILEVVDIEGQSIDIRAFSKPGTLKLEEDESIAQMLKAMKHKQKGKFFVQHIKKGQLKKDGLFSIVQIKNYKWKDITGAVFKITNRHRKDKIFDLDNFIKRFDNVIALYPDSGLLKGKEEKDFFIIQKAR